MVKMLCPQPKELTIKKDRTTPLNQGYPPKRIKSTTHNISRGHPLLTDNEKKRFDEQGFLILENVISTDEADTMRNLALELAQEDIKAGRDYSHLENARRVWNLVNKHEVFEQAYNTRESSKPNSIFG